ncbi:MAG: MFS transporter [Solirubrobacterales bacterium]|nr:MFS transporter [Solirubrobacterales bacterium]
MHRPAPAQPARSPGWTLFVVCLATGLLLLNVAAPNVALRDISADLGATFGESQLIISAYALTLAALLLTGGTLADLHGRKRMFLAGLTIFAATSLAGALATTPELLIASRAAQGVGAAVLLSSSLGLLAQEFEGAARGRALGVWGATVSGAFVIGPLGGGLLTEGFGWQGIFLADVVLALPALWIARARLHESSDPGRAGVDWWGVATLSPALCALVFALVQGNARGWDSPEIVGLFAFGALMLAVFVAVERGRAEPMLDLRLFRIPTFTGSVLVTMALAVSSFAPILYLSLYLLDVVGSSPPEAGLQLAPLAAVALVVSVLTGRVTGRLRLRETLAVGLALCGIGLALMAGLRTDSSWTTLLPGMLVSGVGIGIANPFATFATLGVVPTARSGTAAGINSTFRQLGVAGGIAALGAILQRHVARDEAAGAPYAVAFTDALNELLLIAAGLAIAGALVAMALVRQRDLLVASS